MSTGYYSCQSRRSVGASSVKHWRRERHDCSTFIAFNESYSGRSFLAATPRCRRRCKACGGTVPGVRHVRAEQQHVQADAGQQRAQLQEGGPLVHLPLSPCGPGGIRTFSPANSLTPIFHTIFTVVKVWGNFEARIRHPVKISLRSNNLFCKIVFFVPSSCITKQLHNLSKLLCSIEEHCEVGDPTQRL